MKLIKDVIHGDIVIEESYIIELIETREFQRLKYINQLGVANFVFPAATSTRYNHSIGTFDIANRFLKHLSSHNNITPEQIKIVLSAALLHDIGHGPHSHSFEAYSSIKHEEYTVKIINDKSTEVNNVLRKNNISYEEVCQIIENKHPSLWMSSIISSQLDSDRLDYLERDTYHTGNIYGKVDVNFIIKNSLIHENKLAFNYKALPAIENYLIGRQHMYLQTYYNRYLLGLEFIMNSIVKRTKYLKNQKFIFKDIYSTHSFLKNILEKEEPYRIKEYLMLTDNIMNNFFIGSESENDHVLQELGKMFNKRSNMIIEEYSEQRNLEIESLVKKYPEEKDYIYSVKSIDKYYIYNKEKDPILIEKNNTIKTIDHYSIIAENGQSKKLTRKYIIYNNKISL
jgi:uncharacterized protein